MTQEAKLTLRIKLKLIRHIMINIDTSTHIKVCVRIEFVVFNSLPSMNYLYRGSAVTDSKGGKRGQKKFANDSPIDQLTAFLPFLHVHYCQKNVFGCEILVNLPRLAFQTIRCRIEVASLGDFVCFLMKYAFVNGGSRLHNSVLECQPRVR